MAEQGGERTRAPAGGGWAWLAAGLGAWVVGVTFLVVRALNRGDATDAGLSPYHAPGYVTLAALTVLSAWRAVAAFRAGLGWRRAFPSGYGSLGAGTVVLLVYVVADVAWREGVGIGGGIETGLAPSRLLLPIGLSLVAMAALRAALERVAVGVGAGARWPAAVSAGALMAALAAPGGFHPAISPWLERPSDPGPQTEIWVMDGDGSHQTRLIESTDGTSLGNPVWSPDGTRIAYTTSPIAASNAERDVDIWAARSDGSDAHLLVGGPGWQWFPRWSPDGAWIAYTDESQGGPWLASGPQGPAVGQGAQGPDFGATGTPGQPEADLWRIAADGSGTRVRLTDAPGDDRSATWSPDGRKLAFDSTRDGNTNIYVADADGADPVRLTDQPGEEWAASWSPDGTRIAFTSDRSGTAQVWTMDPDGANPVQLTTDPAGNLWPAWAPDGRRLAITSWQTGDEQVRSIAPDGTDPRLLSRSPATTDSAWDGSWAPNGRILFMRTAQPVATASPIARETLGTAAMLLTVCVLAVVVAMLCRTRPPFGAIAVAMGSSAALVAIAEDGWRFIPAAIAAGLVADVVARLATPGLRTPAAAATAAAGLVLAAVATVWATSAGGVGWSATLWIGVAAAAGVLGWVVGALLSRPGNEPPPAGAPGDPPRVGPEM